MNVQGVLSSGGAGCGASGSQINMKPPSEHRKHLGDKVKCGKWDGPTFHGHSHMPLCVEVCGPGEEKDASMKEAVTGRQFQVIYYF